MSRSEMTIGDPSTGSNRGVAADELRRHNLGAVLERLHLRGPLSRSGLTACTGLNRSTIADLISELIALGLVEEGPGPTASGPGRPSPVVTARPDGAVVLAAEFNVDSIALATIGLGGHVYDRVRVPVSRSHLTPEEATKEVVRLAGPLLDALPPGHVSVGVGVAAAGITRTADGVVHFSPNLGWREVPLGSMLRRGLGVACPVRIANEADLAALGEHRRGSRAGVRHMIFVTGEVGIGCGLIHDGQQFSGAAGYAGEAGHMLVNPDGVRCSCGAVGCWETEAGEAALLRHVGLSADSTGLEALDMIAERAAAGDQTTLDAISEVGRWLGLGIGDLINLFNPEVVVLGGLYQRFYPYLEQATAAGIRLRTLEPPRRLAEVVCTALGADAALIGAAEMIFSDVISYPARVGRSVSI